MRNSFIATAILFLVSLHTNNITFGSIDVVVTDDAFIKDFNRDGMPDAINIYYNEPPYTVDQSYIRVSNNNPNSVVVGESRGVLEFTNVPYLQGYKAILRFYVGQSSQGNSFDLLKISSDGIVTLDDYSRQGQFLFTASGSGLGLHELDVTDFVNPGNNAFRLEASNTVYGGVVFRSKELSVSTETLPPTLRIIPEPCTLSLLVLGVLGLRGRRKKL